MKKIIFYILLLLTPFSFADNAFRLPEQCLHGTWKSDKERTIEYNQPIWDWAWKHYFNEEITPERKQRVYDIFGKIEQTYNPDGTGFVHTYIFEEKKEKARYKIIRAGKNFFVVAGWLDGEKFDEENYNVIFFENPNSFYVKIEPTARLFQDKNSREYFRRITPTPKECVMYKDK